MEEVWLVDMVAGVVETHRQPAETEFGLVEALAPGASVSPYAFPDLRLAVADVLGLATAPRRG